MVFPKVREKRPDILKFRLCFKNREKFYLTLFYSQKERNFYRVMKLLKVNQIDIPDYLYNVSRNGKIMFFLMVLEKEGFHVGIHFLVIKFSKREKVCAISKLLKTNQIDIPEYL